MKTLYIVRGLPGSGKSTFAHTLDCPVFEADMFFVNSEGVYNFDFTRIKDAIKEEKYKEASDLSVELENKIEKLRKMYHDYTKNILDL